MLELFTRTLVGLSTALLIFACLPAEQPGSSSNSSVDPQGAGDEPPAGAFQGPTGETPPPPPAGTGPGATSAPPSQPPAGGGGETGVPGPTPEDPPDGKVATPAPPAEPGESGGCLADVFMDLSDAEGAGATYPAPSVEVSCTADSMTVTANGIPHYPYLQVTPNPLSAQNHSWTIPLNPMLGETMTDIPLLGVAAFTVNGLPIYGPNEGPFPDPFGDPIYNDILDWCLGHTAQSGDYHYHALAEECFFAVGQDEPSPILGFALDGFPIYGPRGCVDADCTEVVEFQSSWEMVGDPTTYAWDNYECSAGSCDAADGVHLDRCNGRIGPDGTYRYHATSTFPYILGCYRGTGASGQAAGGPGTDQPPQGDDDPEPPAGPTGDGQQPPAGGQTGPASCDVEADCDSACPADAAGCTCADSPFGAICVPTCSADSDCPTGGPEGGLTCDVTQGICVPSSAGQGGAPRGGGPSGPPGR